MTLTTLLVIAAVGAGTGFLGGIFGKGGSAVATPVLVALGIPPAIALASPLPATIPATLAAARRYDREDFVNRQVVRICLTVGLPATLVGAAATIWISASSLVEVTEVIVGVMGVGILLGVWRRRSVPAKDGSEIEGAASDARGGAAETTPGIAGARTGFDLDAAPSGAASAAAGAPAAGAVTLIEAPSGRVSPDVDGAPMAGGAPMVDGTPMVGGHAVAPWLVAVVAGTVGLSAGLLANSGGFLLAPLFLLVVRLPVRSALGTSLATAAGLAIPATVAHAALGHISWPLVAAFTLASVPAASIGARTALRVDPQRLEPVFGVGLVVLAAGSLVL